jgi:hypothetical protein
MIKFQWILEDFASFLILLSLLIPKEIKERRKII